MTSWTDYLGNFLRHLLKDTASTPYVSDAVMLVLANQALSVMGEDVGVAASETLSGAGPAYTLPADFTTLRYLERTSSDGAITYLRPAQLRPGDERRDTTSTDPANFLLHWPAQGSLTLLSTPDTGNTYVIYYNAAYEAIEADGDLPFVGWEEVALAMLTSYLAMASEASGRARLEQWSTAPEIKVGNPLREQARWFKKEYESYVARNKA